MAVVFSACMIFVGGYRCDYAKDYVVQARKDLPIPFGIIAVLVVVVTIGSIAGWALFNAKSYAQLLTVEEGDFTAEVSEINFEIDGEGTPYWVASVITKKSVCSAARM